MIRKQNVEALGRKKKELEDATERFEEEMEEIKNEHEN